MHISRGKIRLEGILSATFGLEGVLSKGDCRGKVQDEDYVDPLLQSVHSLMNLRS